MSQQKPWPGALCEVVGAESTPEANGRFVVAVRRAFPGEVIEGVLLTHHSSEIAWAVAPAAAGAKLPMRTEGGRFFYVTRRAFLERLLRPIVPPPSADTTPTDEAEPVETVEG